MRPATARTTSLQRASRRATKSIGVTSHRTPTAVRCAHPSRREICAIGASAGWHGHPLGSGGVLAGPFVQNWSAASRNSQWRRVTPSLASHKTTPSPSGTRRRLRVTTVAERGPGATRAHGQRAGVEHPGQWGRAMCHRHGRCEEA
jgi:hypothetical protein